MNNKSISKPTGVEFCDDYVSRQAALDKAFEIKTGEYTSAMVVYAHDIRTLPPVTPIHKDRTVQDFVDKCRECGKQKKGKWIFTKTIFDKHGCTVECSSCHKKWKTYDEIRWKKENKFCPNCGTKMEE